MFFPDTPYFTRSFNHTHRVEESWEFEILITAATTTGVRVAAIPVDDPTPRPVMNRTIAFQQVANKRAAIASVTGTRDSQARVPMVGTTVRLSNARPPFRSSLVGFAVGSIFLFLLDHPIGIEDTTKIFVTLLARVRLRLFGPFTGFLAFEVKPPVSQNALLRFSDVTKNRQFITHPAGSGYLDANRYLAVYDNGIPLDKEGAKWVTPPVVGEIYTAVVPSSNQWFNVNDSVLRPIYYTVADLGGGDSVFVGFEDLHQARTFVVSPHSVVSGSATGFGSSSKGDKKWNETWQQLPTSGKFDLFFILLGQNVVSRVLDFQDSPGETHCLLRSMSNLSLSSLEQ